MQAEKRTSLVLTQVVGGDGGDTGCFLHIRGLTRLCGYTLCGVGLVSGARIVEVYSGEDYVATSKGSILDRDSR